MQVRMSLTERERCLAIQYVILSLHWLVKWESNMSLSLMCCRKSWGLKHLIHPHPHSDVKTCWKLLDTTLKPRVFSALNLWFQRCTYRALGMDCFFVKFQARLPWHSTLVEQSLTSRLLIHWSRKGSIQQVHIRIVPVWQFLHWKLRWQLVCKLWCCSHKSRVHQFLE